MREGETDAQRAARYLVAAQEHDRLADRLDYETQLLRRVTDCPSSPMPEECEAEGHRKVAWILRAAARRLRAAADAAECAGTEGGEGGTDR
jgi:hypothetical protein